MDIEDFVDELNKTATKHYRKIQNVINHCIYCQTYESGDLIWVFGERTNLDDLFDQHSVPVKYRDAIAQYLSCPNCGRQVFERFEDVGLEDSERAEIRQVVKAAEGRYGQKLSHLQDHLERYPALALSHPLGRKIYREITHEKVVTSSVSGRFFRARLVKGSAVFESADLGAPQTGISGDGRYHHAGQSVLYVSSEVDIAVREILEFNVEKALVWTQEYEIGTTERIIDLTDSEDKLNRSTSALLVALLSTRLLGQEVLDRKNTWKPQYFVTRFIADCARSAGFNGIRYSSTRSHGENVVLFNPNNIPIKEIDRPKVLIYQKKRLSLFGYDIDF